MRRGNRREGGFDMDVGYEERVGAMGGVAWCGDMLGNDCGDLPSALSRVCALAGSRTMRFVSEDAANGRVLVGVDVHGGVRCPGTYRYAGGRLLEVGI